jgi:Leucine-rich repeat (LRR) protein
MSSLLYLNLADNNFFTFPSGLFSVLPSLLLLHLENNRLGDLIADDVNGQLFAGLNKLVLLNLTNNQITKLPEPIFKDLSNLNNLTLTQTLHVLSGFDSDQDFPAQPFLCKGYFPNLKFGSC